MLSIFSPSKKTPWQKMLDEFDTFLADLRKNPKTLTNDTVGYFLEACLVVKQLRAIFDQNVDSAELSSENCLAIKNILSAHWQRISQLYNPFHAPLDLLAAVRESIAKLIFPQVKDTLPGDAADQSYVQIIAPSLTPKAAKKVAESSLRRFVLTEDGSDVIDVLQVLEAWQGSHEENLLLCRIDAQTQAIALTDTEKNRLECHSQELNAYYHSILSLLKRRKEKTLAHMLRKLAYNLRTSSDPKAAIAEFNKFFHGINTDKGNATLKSQILAMQFTRTSAPSTKIITFGSIWSLLESNNTMPDMLENFFSDMADNIVGIVKNNPSLEDTAYNTDRPRNGLSEYEKSEKTVNDAKSSCIACFDTPAKKPKTIALNPNTVTAAFNAAVYGELLMHDARMVFSKNNMSLEDFLVIISTATPDAVVYLLKNIRAILSDLTRENAFKIIEKIPPEQRWDVITNDTFIFLGLVDTKELLRTIFSEKTVPAPVQKDTPPQYARYFSLFPTQVVDILLTSTSSMLEIIRELYRPLSTQEKRRFLFYTAVKYPIFYINNPLFFFETLADFFKEPFAETLSKEVIFSYKNALNVNVIQHIPLHIVLGHILPIDFSSGFLLSNRAIVQEILSYLFTTKGAEPAMEAIFTLVDEQVRKNYNHRLPAKMFEDIAQALIVYTSAHVNNATNGRVCKQFLLLCRNMMQRESDKLTTSIDTLLTTNLDPLILAMEEEAQYVFPTNTTVELKQVLLNFYFREGEICIPNLKNKMSPNYSAIEDPYILTAVLYATYLRKQLSPQRGLYPVRRKYKYLCEYSVAARETNRGTYIEYFTLKDEVLDKIYAHLPIFLNTIKPEARLLVLKQMLLLYIDARTLLTDYKQSSSLLAPQWLSTTFGYRKEEKLNAAKAALGCVQAAINGETFAWPDAKHLACLKQGNLGDWSAALLQSTETPLAKPWYCP